MSGQVNISLEKLNTLQLGEIEEIEELGGVGIGAYTNGTGVPAKSLRALAFVFRRRVEPSITFDDCRTMTLTDFVALLEEAPAPLGKLQQPAKRRAADA